MPVRNRGLKNIRTLSRRVEPGAVAYRGYMQITCLEMERARRCAERNNAAQRIGEIDARLAEIEREKQDLLEALAQDGGKAPRRLPGMEVKSSLQKRPAGFRIRY